MRTLSVDGVRAPGLRYGMPPGLASPETVTAAEPRPVSRPRPIRGISVDGVRRAQALPNDLPMAEPISAALPNLIDAPTDRTGLLQTVIDARYRLGAALTASILIPAAILGTYQLRTAADHATASKPVAASTKVASAAVATEQPTTVAAPKNAQMQKLLDDFAGGQAAPMGLVIKNLKTGEIASRNPDQVFTSASLYKLFVATTVYKQIDSGKLSLGDSVKGRNETVGQCLSDMITWSDNDCGRALGAVIGWGGQDGNLHNLGFKGTTLSDPQATSAGDVALLYERLYNGTLLSPNSSDNFLNLLKAQKVNNRLPASLPGGTVVAHKTGDLDGFVHDAGIVYGPKTDYLVIAVTGPWSNLTNAPAAIADLSKRTYDFLNQ